MGSLSLEVLNNHSDVALRDTASEHGEGGLMVGTDDLKGHLKSEPGRSRTDYLISRNLLRGWPTAR